MMTFTDGGMDDSGRGAFVVYAMPVSNRCVHK